MEENKVVLKLQEYIDLIEENKSLNKKIEAKNKNYIGMIEYIKNEVKNEEGYQIKNFDGKLETSFTNKILNYHYKNIIDSFLEKGIIFDTAVELTDELIKEYLDKKEKSNE